MTGSHRAAAAASAAAVGDLAGAKGTEQESHGVGSNSIIRELPRERMWKKKQVEKVRLVTRRPWD